MSYEQLLIRSWNDWNEKIEIWHASGYYYNPNLNYSQFMQNLVGDSLALDQVDLEIAWNLEITSVWSQGSLANSWSHEVLSSKTAHRHWTTLSHCFKLRLIKSFPVASQIARADILLQNITFIHQFSLFKNETSNDSVNSMNYPLKNKIIKWISWNLTTETWSSLLLKYGSTLFQSVTLTHRSF